jgi:hypothetical protein
MNESNKVFQELIKLNKRVEKLASPEESGTILWGEVGYYLKTAIDAIKKDKRIYGW